MKYDFKDIAFMVHVRLDTAERFQNILAITNFYREHCDNTQFIFIEDNSFQDKRLLTIRENNLGENDIYHFFENNGMYQRTYCYNLASKKTNRKVIVSLDTDIIIHPKYLLATAEKLMTVDKAGIMYPYNGCFLCVNEKIKEEFINSNDYNTLIKYKPSVLQPLFNDGNVLVGHTASVGGCVMFNHDAYNQFKGYNPMFKGWGYEDNEIVNRAKALGFIVDRIKDENAFLWHLPHDGIGQSPKADNPFYKSNERLAVMTDTMTKEQMEEFIKNWEV